MPEMSLLEFCIHEWVKPFRENKGKGKKKKKNINDIHSSKYFSSFGFYFFLKLVHVRQTKQYSWDEERNVEKDIQRSKGDRIGPAIYSRQSAKKVTPRRNFCDSEKYPANGDNNQGIGMLKDWCDLFELFTKAAGFNSQNQTVIGAPDDKVPAGTMP